MIPLLLGGDVYYYTHAVAKAFGLKIKQFLPFSKALGQCEIHKRVVCSCGLASKSYHYHLWVAKPSTNIHPLRVKSSMSQSLKHLICTH